MTHLADGPNWRRYLRFWQADVAADVDDELRFHFEAREAELRAQGLTPTGAARLAAEEFGDVEATRRRLLAIGRRRETRQVRASWWQHVHADLRYTMRGLRAAPLFTGAIVITLALSIGAATTMTAVMRELLLRPPPHVAEAARVRTLHFQERLANGTDWTGDRASYPLFLSLSERAGRVATVAAYGGEELLPIGSGLEAASVRTRVVSAGFWRLLGVHPAAGRFFADAETDPVRGERVAVLSHALWQQRYAGDPEVVGRVVAIRGIPYQIVGVAPRGFRGLALSEADLWLPLFARGDLDHRRAPWYTYAGSQELHLVTRLAPGVSPARAAAELIRLEQRVAVETRTGQPSDAPPHLVRLGTLTGGLGADLQRRPEATVSVWLAGLAGVLLVIACANVASLLLIRARRRRPELAVRLALGMTRRRLTGLLLVESATLCGLGGAASLLVASWASVWVRHTLLPGVAQTDVGAVDGPLLALTLGAVLGTAVMTGLAPTLQARRDVATGLSDARRRGTARRSPLHRTLLIAQTALSTVLLASAGLFVQSLYRVTTQDLGLDVRHVLTARVDFVGRGWSDAEIVAFSERALARVRTLPMVTQASLALSVPLRGAFGERIRLRGASDWRWPNSGQVHANEVAEDFFATTGMQLLAGRGITAADRTGPPVVVVNEALAGAAWPGRSPVGDCVYVESRARDCAMIVGVVRNARSFSAVHETNDARWLYRPLQANDPGLRSLLVHVRPGTEGAEATLRRALHEVEPRLPYVAIEPLGDVLEPEIRPWRVGAAVFTAFGVLAATLAGMGLYAAVAYALAQRTREIGVRIALGAAAGDVVRLVLDDGLRIVTAGLGVGLLVTLVGGRWMAGLLFDTSPRDPVVLSAIALLLFLVAGTASLVPARRAVRVDATDALRSD